MVSIKKVAALICAFCMTIGMVVIARPLDVTSVDENAVMTVMALKLMDEAEENYFRPQKIVTRAKFADISARLFGFNSSAPSITGFTDVKESHPYASSIAVMEALGLMTGVGDGVFAPDSAITQEQAVKVLVCLLGYGLKAEERGGYPSGYLSVALEKKVLSKVFVEVDLPLERGTLAQMIYNILEVKMLVTRNLSAKAAELGYALVNEGTILNDNLHVLRKTGIVNAVPGTSINGGSGTKEGMIEIDGVKYKTSSTNTEDYIGYNVIYYITDNEYQDIQDIILIMPNENRNEVLVVPAANIAKVSGMRTNNEVFEYYEDINNFSRSIKVNLRANAVIFYNGKTVTSADVSQAGLTYDRLLSPSTGEVRFVDYDNDGSFDLIFVEDYKTYIVEAITEDLIYDKHNYAPLNIALQSKDKVIVLNKDRQETGMKSITKRSVLSVAENLNQAEGKYIKIIVSTDVIEGEISETNTSGSEIRIEDKYYKMSEDFHFDRDLEVGDAGVFYLDAFNKVVAFDNFASAEKKYAWYIVGSAKKGLDQTIQLKLFTYKNKFEVLDCADKVRVMSADSDEFVTMSAANALELLGTTEKLIVFNTNSSNKITEIEIPSATLRDGGRLDTGFSNQTTDGRNNLISTSSNDPGADTFILSGTTVAFFVPADKNEKYYRAAACNPREFVSSDGGDVKNISMSAYDISDMGKIGVIIKHMPVSGNDPIDNSDKENPLVLINNLSQALNEDGEVFDMIKGRNAGDKKEFFLDEDFTVFYSRNIVSSGTVSSEQLQKTGYKVSKGDILLIKSNSLTKEATVGELLLSVKDYYDAEMAAIASGKDVSNPNYINPVMKKNVYGFSRRTDAFGVCMGTELMGSDLYVKIVSNNPVYDSSNINSKQYATTYFTVKPTMVVGKYNYTTEKYTAVTAGEAIAKGTKVLVRMQEASVRDVFVIEY